jgi:hypothetical protein
LAVEEAEVAKVVSGIAAIAGSRYVFVNTQIQAKVEDVMISLRASRYSLTFAELRIIEWKEKK